MLEERSDPKDVLLGFLVFVVIPFILWGVS